MRQITKYLIRSIDYQQLSTGIGCRGYKSRVIRDGVGISFTYRVKSKIEITSFCTSPSLIKRREDVALRNDATNVREVRYKYMVFIKYRKTGNLGG